LQRAVWRACEEPRRGRKPREGRASTVGNGGWRYRPGLRSKASKVAADARASAQTPRGQDARGDAGRLGSRELLRGAGRVAGSPSAETGSDPSPGPITSRRAGGTRRTPGSAAGCNKPALQQVEQTVEVASNHEDGTGRRRGASVAEAELSERASARADLGGSGHLPDTSMEGRGSPGEEDRLDRASGGSIRAEPGR
jgi:hypothetical protein